MDRRDFIKLASMAGLGVVVGGLPNADQAKAADEVYTGPLWLSIHASGGWDPTSLCDPKGAASAMDGDPMNHYLASDIMKIGPFNVAPYTVDPADTTKRIQDARYARAQAAIAKQHLPRIQRSMSTLFTSRLGQNELSMLLMGAGIPGGKVIGQTTDRHAPVKLDPVTLQPNESGIVIKPGHIHRALRKLAGIQDSAV